MGGCDLAQGGLQAGVRGLLKILLAQLQGGWLVVQHLVRQEQVVLVEALQL